MSSDPFVVSFVGPSGVGKTTLIEQLIPRLRARGLRVGTVKHAPHGHEVLDKPGSDSARHRSAGAEAVLLAGPDGAVLFLDADAHDPDSRHHHDEAMRDQREVARLGQLVGTHLGHVDVVIAEGFAPIRHAVVTLHRAGVPSKRALDQGDVWFRISDEPVDGDVGWHEIDEISRRIASGVHAKRHRARSLHTHSVSPSATPAGC